MSTPQIAQLQGQLIDLSSELTNKALQPTASCATTWPDISSPREIVALGVAATSGAALTTLPRMIFGGSPALPQATELVLRGVGFVLLGSACGIPSSWLARFVYSTVFVIYSQSPKIKAGGGNSMNTKIYRCEGKEMPPAGEGVRGKKCSWPVAVVRARRLYLEQIWID